VARATSSSVLGGKRTVVRRKGSSSRVVEMRQEWKGEVEEAKVRLYYRNFALERGKKKEKTTMSVPGLR